MNRSSLPPLHCVLSLGDHGGSLREQGLYGGPMAQRMMNVTGRWVSVGTEAAPLLVWPSVDVAEADAAKATTARGRPVVVRQVGGFDFDRFIAPFGPQHASALLGYLPAAAAAARKLEVERRKLMGYATVMLAAATRDPLDSSTVAMAAMKTAARELRLAGIGNGSWVSAAQGLTGERTRELAEMVLDGELPCDQGISPSDILKAMAIAQLLAPKT